MKIKFYGDERHCVLPLYPATISVNYKQEPIRQETGSEFHQIFIVSEGNCVLRVNREMHILERGDMFFLPAHQPHEYGGGEDFKTTFMGFFGGEALFQYFSVQEAAVHRGNASTQLKVAFRELYDIFAKEEEAMICARAFSLAMMFFGEMTAEQRPSLEPVCNYMEENFSREIALEEIVKISGMSKSKLSHDFKRQYGMTVFEKLTEIRLTHARFMLENQPILRVKTVAEQCGYRDESYFCLQFRRKYGKTPGALRKKMPE